MVLPVWPMSAVARDDLGTYVSSGMSASGPTFSHSTSGSSKMRAEREAERRQQERGRREGAESRARSRVMDRRRA